MSVVVRTPERAEPFDTDHARSLAQMRHAPGAVATIACAPDHGSSGMAAAPWSSICTAVAGGEAALTTAPELGQSGIIR